MGHTMTLSLFEEQEIIGSDVITTKYTLVDKIEQIYDVWVAYKDKDILAFDLEFDGLNAWKSRQLLWQLSDGDTTFIGVTKDVPLEFLRSVLQDKILIAHNAVTECKQCMVNELYLDKFIDPLLAIQVSKAGLLEKDLRKYVGLDDLIESYLGIVLDKTTRKQFIGHKGNKFTDRQLQYAADDVVYLHQLWNKIRKELVEKKLLHIAEREFELIPSFARMELTGMKINRDEWQEYIDTELRVKYEQITNTCLPVLLKGLNKNYRDQVYDVVKKKGDKEVGKQARLFNADITRINISSHDQVLKAYQGLGIDLDNTEKASLREALEQKLSEEARDIVEAMIDHSMYAKMLHTYGDNMLNKIDKSGQVWTNIHQCGASATGRCASSNPINLQNVPARGEIGSKFRSFFLSREGTKLIIADYSALEQRIAAHYSQDKTMMRIFEEGLDMHGVSASGIFKIPYEEIEQCGGYDRSTGEYANKKAKCSNGLSIKFMRDECSKTCGFATNYGGGPSTLMRTLKKPLGEILLAKNLSDRGYNAEAVIKNEPVWGNLEYATVIARNMAREELLKECQVSQDKIFEWCKQIYDDYTGTYSGLFAFMETQGRKAITEGYTETLTGRKRFYWPNPKYEDMKRFRSIEQREAKLRAQIGKEVDGVLYTDDDFRKDQRGLVEAIRRQGLNHPVQSCLPYKTKVLTSNGYIQIGELHNTEYIARPEFVWTGTQWKKYRTIQNPSAKLLTIKLNNGQSFTCDLSHKVLVSTNTGYEWKLAKELQMDEPVCFSYPKLLEYGTPTATFTYKDTVHNCQKITVESEQLTDLWYILGYYYGDGWIHRDRAISFVFGKHERRSFDKITRIMSSFGFRTRDWKEQKHKNGGTAFTTDFYSKQFITYLQDIVGVPTNQGAKTKRLPTSLWSAPLEHRISFMLGLFDSDGCKTGEARYRVIKLANRELLEEVQLLMRTIGLRAVIYNCGQKNTYSLNIKYTPSIVDVFPEAYIQRFNRDHDSKLPRDIVNRLLLSQKPPNLRQSAQVLLSRLKHGGFTSIPAGITIAKDLGIDIDDILYDTVNVCSVEELDIKEDVYTLEVLDEKHRYDSEGIISKNCAADIIKYAMLLVDKEFEEKGWRKIWGPEDRYIGAEIGACIICQIHDEIIVQCDELISNDVLLVVESCMLRAEESIIPSVPPGVSCNMGDRWSDK